MAVETEEDAVSHNLKSLLSNLVIVTCSLSIPFFRVLSDWFPGQHPVFAALLAGLFISIVTYPAMLLADHKFALSNAVLLGLLVSEFTIYGAPYGYSSPLTVTFFLFMYYMGREEAEHLWPESYENKNDI